MTPTLWFYVVFTLGFVLAVPPAYSSTRTRFQKVGLTIARDGVMRVQFIAGIAALSVGITGMLLS